MGDDAAAMKLDYKLRRADEFTKRVATEGGFDLEGDFIRIGRSDGRTAYARAYTEDDGYKFLVMITGVSSEQVNGNFKQSNIVQTLDEAVSLIKGIRRGMFSEAL